MSVQSPGLYSIPVQCSTPAGISALGREEVETTLNVLVDTSPPFMEYVDDSSVLANDTEISYFTDRIRVAFLGNDSETKVTRYYYSLIELFTNTMVVNSTPSLVLDGLPHYITEDSKRKA